MKFCLVGTGRCGSTVLMRMLNFHPDIHVFNETHWIPKMHEIFGTGKGYQQEFLQIVEKTYHITDTLVTEVDRNALLQQFGSEQEISLQHFCDALGMQVATAHGKRWWADKTPDYGPWLGVLKKHWPDFKCLHLVRHGAEVATSMSRHPGYQWMAAAGDDSWCPASFNQYYSAVPISKQPMSVYAALWYRRLMRIRNETADFPAQQYREFQFESLASQPEQTLSEMARFVGLEPVSSWLDRCLGELDIDRIRKRIESRKLDFMGPREMRLLRQLGYEE